MTPIHNNNGFVLFATSNEHTRQRPQAQAHQSLYVGRHTHVCGDCTLQAIVACHGLLGCIGVMELGNNGLAAAAMASNMFAVCVSAHRQAHAGGPACQHLLSEKLQPHTYTLTCFPCRRVFSPLSCSLPYHSLITNPLSAGPSTGVARAGWATPPPASPSPGVVLTMLMSQPTSAGSTCPARHWHCAWP